MASQPKPLAAVTAQIKQNQSVTLDEGVAGASVLAFLKQVFPHQKEFCVTGCQLSTEPPSGTEAITALTWSGSFQQLFPWKNVRVDVSLFDSPSAVAQPERHVVFRLTIPSDSEAVSYFKQSGARELEDIISTIRFNAQPMLFSSLDYSLLPKDDRTFYPSTYAMTLPKDLVRKGLNFQVEATLDDDLTGYVWELLQQNGGGRHVLPKLTQSQSSFLRGKGVRTPGSAHKCQQPLYSVGAFS
ncbi:MAG: hypothetical protein JSR62_06480 [Nitrospira sp.]|nr:hypothetical protein [Nitrospira sp.]